jgi:hypothetical protein
MLTTDDFQRYLAYRQRLAHNLLEEEAHVPELAKYLSEHL